MKNNNTALEAWKQLYDLAQRFVEKKPWTYLDNDHLIQISPRNKPVGYFTILGTGGFQTGCVLYLGDDGLNDLSGVFAADFINISPEYANFNQNCIAMFLGNRDEVSKEQYDIIKQIGLSFRGKGNWIYFESYETGYIPSLLMEEEVSAMVNYMDAMLAALDNMDAEKITIGLSEVYSYVETDNQWHGHIAEFPQKSYHMRVL